MSKLPARERRALAPFEAGDWHVVPELNKLTAAGREVTVEPRVMELLACLARHAGRTVSKDELLAEVWNGAFVVESVVAKTVSALRQALGDQAEQPTYILTVPRRGYRLLAPVRWLDGDGPDGLSGVPEEAGAYMPAAAARRPRTWLPAALGLAALLLAAALLMIWVRGRAPAPSEAGDGSAPRTRDATPAAGELPDEAGSRLPPSTYRKLLEARLLWSRRGIDDLGRAHRLFVEVVAEAPDFGPGHAWQALSFVTASNYGIEPRATGLSQAETAAGRALALAPEDPVAHTAAGLVALNRHLAADRAVREYRRALELAPGFAPAHQFLAEALSAAGRHEEAVAAARRATTLEPTSALMQGVEGLVLQAAGRAEEALVALDRSLVLDPRFAWFRRYRAYALIRLGRDGEAAQELLTESRGAAAAPQNLAALEQAVAAQGLAGYWQWRVDQLLAGRDRGLPVLRTQLAEALAARGRTEEALRELELGPVAEEAEYFLHYRGSPAFDTVRGDPRFRAVYARYGL